MNFIIPWIIKMLIGRGVKEGTAQKIAAPILVAGVVIVGALIFYLAIGHHDKQVINNNNAKQTAAVAKADQKADAHAADSRVADQSRADAESTAIKEAVQHAKTIGADPRPAYYACVKLQQSATAHHQPPPAC